MDKQGIRWIQRLCNFQKAFKQLERGVEEATSRDLSDLEKEGLIQRFEYNQELSWSVIKDFYEYIGEIGIQGSRDAYQLSVKRGLIDANCGKILMESIKSRNLTLKTVYALEEMLHELYLPYTFDISIFRQIDNEDLIDHIRRVGKIFYERKREDE